MPSANSTRSAVIADYRFASTPDQAIIFLQIDQDTQCLFGEHLLPQYLWLATGGNATPADRAAHIDLADWIIQFLTNNK